MSMSVVQPDRAQMEACIARFRELEPVTTGLPDMQLDGCHRTFLSVLGFSPPRQDGQLSPFGNAVTPRIGHLAAGFGVSFIQCTPGNGVLMHNHDTHESFMVLDGRWKLEWEGVDGPDHVTLGAWDFVCFPVGVQRRFECVEAASGHEKATLLGIVQGDEPAVELAPASHARLVEAGILPRAAE